MTINSFTGNYRFLSNFWPVIVSLDNVDYQSVEHAYQAAKVLEVYDEHQNGCCERRKVFLTGTAAQAKLAGRMFGIRPDWEEVKLGVMESLLNQKFKAGSENRDSLNKTRGSELIEGNYWHDNFWGCCTCKEHKGAGRNELGKLLMKIRDRT